MGPSKGHLELESALVKASRGVARKKSGKKIHVNLPVAYPVTQGYHLWYHTHPSFKGPLCKGYHFWHHTHLIGYTLWVLQRPSV